MPTPSPATGPRLPLSLEVGDLTVCFTWQDDRWAHEVVGGDGRRWRSVEGPGAAGGDPRWPASPVLVELSRLETTRGPAVLGVGRAGRSHFSLSVDADPTDPGWLRFEIACRLQEPPAWLGSTYHGPTGLVRIAPGLVTARPPATVTWAYAFSSGGILPLGETRRGGGPASPED